MKLFLLAISIFWITIGLTAVISPLRLKKFYSSMTKLAKKLFILPLLIGAAFRCVLYIGVGGRKLRLQVWVEFAGQSLARFVTNKCTIHLTCQ